MGLVAKDIMHTDVHVVRSDISLVDLERRFLAHGVSGFPVVDDGKLVGIVSRSDVVRTLSVEQTLSETISYLYKVHTDDDDASDAARELDDVGTHVGRRVAQLLVRELMTRNVISVGPELPVADLARTLCKHKIHRVPVIGDDGKLLGIVSTLDLATLFVNGQVNST